MHADTEKHKHTDIPPLFDISACVFPALTWQYDINIKLFLKDVVTEVFSPTEKEKTRKECSNRDKLDEE